MTTIPQPLAPTFAYSLTYDAWNRLVSLEGGSFRQEHEYDGLGRRIERRTGYMDDFVFVVTDARDYYYNESWQLLAETKDGVKEGTEKGTFYFFGERR